MAVSAGTSCPRCGRPGTGGALCESCDRRALMENLAAAVPGDPLRFLRQKVVEDELTIADLSRELAWEEGRVRRLVEANRRHLHMAERTRRLGRVLNGWYRGGAVSIFTNILAIMIGFGIAGAWQARQDELRDLRGQLAVLNPLSEEINFNAQEAVVLQPSSPDRVDQCKFQGLKNDVWKRLEATAEVALLDPLLGEHVEDAYGALADVLVGPLSLSRGKACVKQLKALAQTFQKLDQAVATARDAVKRQMRARAQEPATRGLFNFVGRTLFIAIGILLLPGAVYWAMLVASRFVR